MFWRKKNPIIGVNVYDANPYIHKFVSGKGHNPLNVMIVGVAKEMQSVVFAVRLPRRYDFQAFDARFEAAHNPALQLAIIHTEGSPRAVSISMGGPTIDAMFDRIAESLRGQFVPQIDVLNQMRAAEQYRRGVMRMIGELELQVLQLVQG